MIKNCIRCGNPFNANPVIKNDNVCRTCDRMNSMAFWFPVLQEYSVPVPKTILIHVDSPGLGLILDDKFSQKQMRFFEELNRAVDIVGLPAFLRTEMTSNKHDWKNSCFIEQKGELIHHIRNLVEMSEMARIDRGLDYHFLAVREYIETDPAFIYFRGDMPITKEIRIFVRNGEIECMHPYWPEDIFKDLDKKLINEVRSFNTKENEMIDKFGNYIGRLFTGYWSIDLLKEISGNWYCTDMAIGEASWHDPDCKRIKKDK